MQQVACPGCGAPVQLKSAASIMAVCEFCKTTLLKDAESVVNLGKMSEVLEDYSPLQIGTSGQFGQRSFSLIGRLQLQYSDGFWNEWYVLFDDGSSGWLSDASGQFTMTFAKTTGAQLPLFEKLVPGRTLTVSGQIFTASDVRTAHCTAGQGELPFKVGQGYVAQVADFRTNDRFLTLDYSDANSTRVYVGQSVELADLKPQLLRDAATISDAAGHFRGKVSALTCPSCGAAVKCVPGLTVHIVCPNCHTAVDTAGSVATVLAAGQSVERVRFTLELGSDATISGARYTVLGEMRRSDGESAWSEYLLYSPGKKFIWLIETEEGWQSAEVLDRWPTWDGAGHASLDQHQFDKSSEYSASVLFAAGSFNWRVKIGDTVRVTEFSSGPLRLAAEVSREEMTWSRSSAVPLDQVRAWFGAHVQAEEQPHPGYRATAKKILFPMLIVNAIPLTLASGNVLVYTLLAAAAIYIPAWFLDTMDSKKP
jgi:Domain of unknown function (DUF4178)